MPGLIEVTWCPNPLRPASGREVRRLLSTGSDTVESLIRRLGLHGTPLVATLNSVPLRRRRWNRKRVRLDDVLILQQRARGGEVAAKIIMDFAWYEIVGSAVLSVLTSNFAIGLALNFVASSLLSKGDSGSGASAATADNSVAAYGIEGGANQARPYAPLPLVLGEHRLFPDYAGRPFTEFVVDLSTGYEVINSTPVFEARAVSPFYVTIISFPEPDWAVPAPWTLHLNAHPIRYYVDHQARTYTYQASNGALVTETPPHTFVVKFNTSTNDMVVTTWEDAQAELNSISPPETGGGGESGGSS